MMETLNNLGLFAVDWYFIVLIMFAGLYAMLVSRSIIRQIIGLEIISKGSMQNRMGPPWFEPAADFVKLMSKEVIIPEAAYAVLFRALPYFAIAALMTAFISIPVWQSAVKPYPGDLIAVVYLLMIPTITFFLAGWSSTSPYSTIGSMFFSEKPDRVFIAEEFIDGGIETFDGLTDKQGKIVFCTSHVYDRGVMESVLSDNHVFYYSRREIPPDLEVLGRKVVSAFDVRGRFFHLEFFRLKTGKIYALEVNMRPPGGFTMDMTVFPNEAPKYTIRK